ncbi:MAG: hypothetical protein KF739_02850 [Cryobacterium sp.]|nr:hypothetical protein [Cryobacterium sp.]
MAPLENWWLNALWSVTPTLMLGLVFWFIFRAIFRADRAERRAYAKVEAEERARGAAEIARDEQEDA